MLRVLAHPLPRKILTRNIFPRLSPARIHTKPPEKPLGASAAKRLYELAKPESKLVGVSFGAMLLSSMSTLVFPSVFGQIIDVVANEGPGGGLETLNTCTLGLVGVFTVGALANFVRILSLEIASERIVKNLRAKLFASMVFQEVKFFDRHHTAQLATRLSNDAAVMSETIVEDSSQGFKRIIEGIGGLGILFYLSPQLTAIVLALVPPLALGAVSFGRFAKMISKQKTDALSSSSAQAQERLLAIKTVKSFTQEQNEIATYTATVDKVFQLAKKKALYYGVFSGGVYFAVNAAMLGILYSGALQIISGAMSVGQLATFLFYSLYVGVAFGGISSFWSQLNKAFGSSARVFELLDTYSIESDPTIKGLTLPNLKGNIQLNQISFAYPARPDINVLNGLSIDIKAGTTLAIVGQSGCGKSTIGALLTRFYQPQQGQILIDGVDISLIDVRWLRSQIAVVSQDIMLFSGTIADNIRYGDPAATDEEITAVSKQANCHQFIQEFPQGYSTQVGEKGMQLSGGQKQRLAIARALLKRPAILILDEATSSLDPHSQFLVQEALERARQGRTVILIAHRLSTVKSGNLIAVVEKGSIKEVDTYANLMAKPDGAFQQLIKFELDRPPTLDDTPSDPLAQEPSDTSQQPPFNQPILVSTVLEK